MTRTIPLTTFEEFLFWEDRPAYPWTCFIRLRLSGVPDRAALESALHRVLKRHPLLRSTIQTRGRRRPLWVEAESPQPEVRWMEGPTAGAIPPTLPLDLRNEIGLRLLVVQGQGTSDLIVQFHHACCDGAGIFMFIGDLLIAYALERGETSKRVRLPELDPQLLKRRGKYGLTPWKLLKMAPKQLIGLQGARQFLSRSPIPVLPHQTVPDDDPPPVGYPTTECLTFSKEETSDLRETARRQRVTVNDVVARDFFLALRDWRNQLSVPEDDAWLRMMIPMNLRSPSDRMLSAVNVVSSVFLDRRGPDFCDPACLLKSVHEEMELIKRNRLGLTFVLSLKVTRLLPGGLKASVRKDKCTISSIFTNLGKPLVRSPLPKRDGRFVAGDVVLEDIDVVAPIRPYNCVTLAASIYAGRLSLTLHYDPRPVAAEQASDLLGTLASQVRTSIAARNPCCLQDCSESQ